MDEGAAIKQKLLRGGFAQCSSSVLLLKVSHEMGRERELSG